MTIVSKRQRARQLERKRKAHELAKEKTLDLANYGIKWIGEAGIDETLLHDRVSTNKQVRSLITRRKSYKEVLAELGIGITKFVGFRTYETGKSLNRQERPILFKALRLAADTHGNLTSGSLSRIYRPYSFNVWRNHEDWLNENDLETIAELMRKWKVSLFLVKVSQGAHEDKAHAKTQSKRRKRMHKVEAHRSKREVLEMQAKGYTPSQIAKTLRLSINTVKEWMYFE